MILECIVVLRSKLSTSLKMDETLSLPKSFWGGSFRNPITYIEANLYENASLTADDGLIWCISGEIFFP